MKGFLTASVLMLAVTFVTDANALFTRCEISYQTKSLAFGLEVGGGEGRARCWDAIGDSYVTRFDIIMGGLGLTAGYCETAGRFSAAGVGFTLSEVLSVMGQVELGPRFTSGNGIAAGVRVSPLGANVNLTLSNLRYRGPCLGLASAQGLISTNVGRPARERRRNPYPILPPPIEEMQPEVLR